MGALEKSPPSSNSTQRVKVYRLNEEGKWDDQGTGHVTVDFLERSEDLGLFVIDEVDNETILLHRISSDDIYRKQEETIISWRDPEYSTELALSFQDYAGASYVWDHICSVQRNSHFSTLNSEVFQSVNNNLRELPTVELSTLPLILKVVTESGITEQMRVTELILRDPEFFRKLMDLFRVCEDLENIDSLHMIYKIVKGIILLNNQQLFEKIFSDELIMDIIGSLEYDPELSQVQHRNFLKEHVVFKEAIPIRDQTALSKIHQTYRIGYLKDVMLPRVLDDAAISTLNSMIHGNNATVVSLLKDDGTFIQELFARLRSSTTSAESKKNLVFFLHEFCTLSKSLQMVQQLRLFRDFVNEGIFDIITDVLRSEDKRFALTGTDILILFLNQDSNLLRSYVIRPEGAPLLGLLVQGMLTDFGDDMHCQFLEILRSLLDTYTVAGPQRDAVIEMFYEKHLCQLIDVITSSCPDGDASGKSAGGNIIKHTSRKPEILLNVCELLCFCVVHHPYRIKCNFLLGNVIEKVLRLTQKRERYLVVAAIRFIRTIISRNDDNLSNYIVKHNLFKPIVDAFVANGDRYNLLNSAILDLLEYIRKENLKILLKYLVESFWNQLGKFEYMASIQALKVKYEQSLESSGAKTSINVVDSRKRADDRALEKEEEDYFNEDSDEEDTTSASPAQRAQANPAFLLNGSGVRGQSLSSTSGGLVDYDDDEDDEDYKPPPRRQTDTSASDGALESLSLKRKMTTGGDSGLVKKQRLDKSLKPKDSVFAALCSTLSQAVLPGKKGASTVHNVPQGCDAEKGLEKESNQEKETDGSKSQEEDCSSDHLEKEKSSSRASSNLSDHQSADDRNSIGEKSASLRAQTSSETAVNGS